MSIDWTINLGHILTIVGLVSGGLVFVLTVRSDVNSIKATEGGVQRRLDAVEGDLRKITDVLVEIARQDERLNAHAARILSLEEAAHSHEHP